MRLGNIQGLTVRLAIASLAAAVAGCTAQDLEPLPVEEHDDHGPPSAVVMGDTLTQSFTEEDGWLVSPPLAAPEGATRVALMIDLRGGPTNEPVVEARGLAQESSAEWLPVEVVWQEGAFLVGRAELGFVADAVQVRVPVGHDEVLEGLTYEAVLPEQPDESGVELEAPAEAEQGLATDLKNIGVISRGQWGARRTRCTSGDAGKSRIAVHHTVTAPTLNGNYAARVRQIQAFHMDGRGWCDVGYHFLVTRDGRLWEGRPVNLLGAHVYGHNTDNVGVSFVGCFQPGACDGIASPSVPEKMVAGGAKLIRRLAARYGIPRDRSHIKGHRDHSGASTSCPGDNLHARLPALRNYEDPNTCREVARVAGASRYATAAEFSQNNFDRARRVVLVSGADDNPAALVAGPLANKVGGPVLLTAKNSLPTATRQELQRLGARRVFVVGGEGVIAPRVERQLENMGITAVRVGGNNRYQVAANVARRVGSPNGLAFVVAGDNPIGALSAATAASSLGAPLLYVGKESVPASTAAAIADLGITKVFVVGGAGSVSNAVLGQLPSATRVRGANRYQTSVAVANIARRRGAGTHRVHITRGDITRNGVLVAATGRLQLLSNPDSLGGAAREFLSAHANRVTLMGGTGALSTDVQRAACHALD